MVSGIGSSNNSNLSSIISEMREKYNSMDTDSDGQVSESEFLTAAKSETGQSIKDKPPAGELPPLGERPSGPPPAKMGGAGGLKATGSENEEDTEETENVFNEADTNGDGYISVSENEEYIQKMALKMYRNLQELNADSVNPDDYLNVNVQTTSSSDLIKTFKEDMESALDKYSQYNEEGEKSNTENISNNLYDFSV